MTKETYEALGQAIGRQPLPLILMEMMELAIADVLSPLDPDFNRIKFRCAVLRGRDFRDNEDVHHNS